MARTTVMGAGSWGTAFSVVLADIFDTHMGRHGVPFEEVRWPRPQGGRLQESHFQVPRSICGAQPLRRRGTGWHFGQKYDERFMKATRRIGVPHRSHGSPSRP